MKYWYFAEGKVAGPLEAEQIRSLPGFEASTLVCPENKTGTNADDWKPASDFPDLTSAGVATSQPAAGPPPAAASDSLSASALEPLQTAVRELSEKILKLEAEVLIWKQKTEQWRQQTSSPAPAVDLTPLQNRLDAAVKDFQAKLTAHEENVSKVRQAVSANTDEIAALKANVTKMTAALAQMTPPPKPAAPEPASRPAPQAKTAGSGKKRLAIAAGAAVTLVSLAAAGAYYALKPKPAELPELDMQNLSAEESPREMPIEEKTKLEKAETPVPEKTSAPQREIEIQPVAEVKTEAVQKPPHKKAAQKKPAAAKTSPKPLESINLQELPGISKPSPSKTNSNSMRPQRETPAGPSDSAPENEKWPEWPTP